MALCQAVYMPIYAVWRRARGTGCHRNLSPSSQPSTICWPPDGTARACRRGACAERTRVVLRSASAAGGDSVECWSSTGLAGPNSAFPDACGYRALKQSLNCQRRASAGAKVVRCHLSSPPKNAPLARRVQNRLIRIHFSVQFSMRLMVVKPLNLIRGPESAILDQSWLCRVLG